MKKKLDSRKDSVIDGYCQCKRCPHCGKLIKQNTGWVEFPPIQNPAIPIPVTPYWPNITWCNNGTSTDCGLGKLIKKEMQ